MKRFSKKFVSICAVAIMAAAGTSSWADTASWRFAIISDTQGYITGNNGVGEYANMIARAIMAEDPPVDFVLMGGDLICGDEGRPGQPPFSEMLQNWFGAMKPLYEANIPVYPIRGNHEATFVTPQNDPTQFLAAFANFKYIPENGPDNAKRLTYGFEHKNSLVIGIDNYIDGVPNPTVPQAWLDQQLASNKQPHVFVFGHAPIVQIGTDAVIAKDKSQGDAFFDSLVNAGAEVYFCGHEHLYNRAVLTRNGKHLCQFVEGTGGGRHFPWLVEGYNTGLPECDITAQLACYNIYLFGYTLVTVTSDSSFNTTWRVFSNGTSSTTCDSLDQFDFSYSKYATYAMDSTLFVDTGVSASASASTAYTLTATGKYTDPVKGTTKSNKKETLKSSSLPGSFDYQWLDKILLWNKKLWDPTKTAEENLAIHPIAPVECDMTVAVKGGSTSTETVAYCPPMITSAVDTSGNQLLSITTGLKFHLYGSYFGSKAPSVWLEYTKNGKVVALNLKVDPSSYAFTDAKGKANNSCMDIATGNSALVLIAPSSWPKGWDTTASHNIVLDNGLGRATIDLATQPPN